MPKKLRAIIVLGTLSALISGCFTTSTNSTIESNYVSRENVNYLRNISTVTSALSTAYSELDNLLDHQKDYNPVDWRFFFEKNKLLVERSYSIVSKLNPPSSQKKFNDKCIKSLKEMMIALNQIDSTGKQPVSKDEIAAFDSADTLYSEIESNLMQQG